MDIGNVRAWCDAALCHRRRSKTHVRMKARSGAGNLPIFFPDYAEKPRVTRNFAEVYLEGREWIFVLATRT